MSEVSVPTHCVYIWPRTNAPQDNNNNYSWQSWGSETLTIHTDNMEQQTSIWTYDKVLLFMQVLRRWIERDVPASRIGIFIVEILYRTDAHMSHRVTRMVDNQDTYENIAKAVVQYYQIRDENYRPLWTQLAPGEPELRAGLDTWFLRDSVWERPINHTNGSETGTDYTNLSEATTAYTNGSETTAYTNGSAISQEHGGLTLYAPKPIQRVRWPFWPNPGELEALLNGEGPDEEELPYDHSSHTDGDIPCYGHVNTGYPKIEETGPLPVSMTAEIVDPQDELFPSETNLPEKDIGTEDESSRLDTANN